MIVADEYLPGRRLFRRLKNGCHGQLIECCASSRLYERQTTPNGLGRSSHAALANSARKSTHSKPVRRSSALGIKTGTARGWPRRSRTAEASHISRCAVKLRCAREQGGWGRLSVDGRDSITRTGARAPGVGGVTHRMVVQYIASTDPTLGGSMLKHEGRRQTDRRSVYAGSRLKLIDVSGRSRLIASPPAVLRKTHRTE